MRTLQRLALSICCIALNSGCWVLLPSLDDEPETDEPASEWPNDVGAGGAGGAGPTTPDVPPPSISYIDVPDWPPIGPDGEVTVSVTSSAPLSILEYGFKNFLVRSPSETTVTGLELGEGFGTLSVRATDTRGGFASRDVTDLLVDLTPPEITLGQTVVSHDGMVAFWVADAWILGRVEIEFSGARRSHQFQIGYPETLGESWDVSLVEFHAEELPEGAGPARIRAVDAAGNEVTEEFDLVIDGTPPRVALLEPAEGAVVTDELRVTVQAYDETDLPVRIDLAAGGATVATASGPLSTIVLDASDFPPGPMSLAATAIDQAGNESELALVQIVIGEPAPETAR